ncbi:CarboxypepD_reg-like domain-containing protein [Mucilaginibacter pineti]|uniref:CarboxypepD_reg-like domain-containing protein n=1 Tax=Mucilaginibacter pineti TaxID=1391627 RepID=A0A1G6UZU4_9SPHI|nr:outer membrane beta-barrel protein [Mucilaginibacter pineti]SDD46166.1 CarboxypepD_reg-like domain-containing protein [Mucilaginibacter pineti]
MKKILLILIMVAILGGGAFAQNVPVRKAVQPPPLSLRQVSGIVKDSTDETLVGAMVKLVSPKDTVSTATNANGIFIFKNIRSATFTLTISSMGYRTLVKKMLNNDAVPRLVLDPIILKSQVNALKEVSINGTPSIVYKTDTVEYRASDYKVRENATVDELLKKMEGMEVGSDGTVTHQGQQITKAKLNGKEYAGGDVAQAIQNLPADIVDKIQVVDDYGDQAARTGIKDGDPQKILNITTRADKSVGTTGRITTQAGNNDRYNGQLFVQRIDANEQLGVIGRIANTVTGVASTGIAGGATNGGGGGTGVGAGAGRGGSPGTTFSASPSFNYRDQWNKKLQVVASYAYRYSDNNSVNSSYGQRNSTLGSTDFTSQSTRESKSKGHNVNFEMDYSIDSANYLQVTPTFSYSSATSSSSSLTDNINNFTTGFEHPVVSGVNSNLNSAPNYGATVFYQHIFKKPHRNASVQFSINRSNSQANGDVDNDYHYYFDTTRDSLLKDSASHLLTNRTSKNTTYRTSVTYVEPISLSSQFEFNGQVRTAVYDNKAISDTVLANGQVEELTRLDNIYNYSFTETRATFNYRYNGKKVNLSLGTTLVPTLLKGTKINNGNSENVSTSRSDFKIIPVFRLSYSWSRTERISLAYSGSNTEPNFQQIQPFTDRSDPNNIIVGNPNLNPTFTNSLNLIYNNYLPNSKFNLSFNLNGTTISNQATTNVLQIKEFLSADPADPTNPAKFKYRTINEIHYININGSHAIVGRYNIAKQFDDRRYNLSLNGNVTYSYNNAMSNSVLYHNTNWRFDERFGPRISPNDWLEVNPYIGYDVSRSFTTLRNADPTSLRTTSLGIDGRVYFLKTFQVNYSASKNYVDGLTGITSNPFVINAGFEKEFFAKKNLVLTFNVYDILHQNNFIQQTLSPQGGYTNTLSSTLSRYFLVGLRLNLQKWSGSPKRNGKNMNRRGDGSFIYD